MGRRGLEPLTPCVSSTLGTFAAVHQCLRTASDQVHHFGPLREDSGRFKLIADRIANKCRRSGPRGETPVQVSIF